jgi:hypothetical protein
MFLEALIGIAVVVGLCLGLGMVAFFDEYNPNDRKVIYGDRRDYENNKTK